MVDFKTDDTDRIWRFGDKDGVSTVGLQDDFNTLDDGEHDDLVAEMLDAVATAEWAQSHLYAWETNEWYEEDSVPRDTYHGTPARFLAAGMLATAKAYGFRHLADMIGEFMYTHEEAMA